MRYRSMFDIIGPPMAGPSSSHTAGANRIGQIVRAIHEGTPKNVRITLYGSFAETYRGHGTDRAILAGLMGMKPDDARMRDALNIAAAENIRYELDQGTVEGIHPNSVRIRIEDGHPLDATGISIGGGRIEIIELNGYNIRLSGDYPTLIIEHLDQVGVIKDIGLMMARYHINVSHMEVDRRERAGQAMAVVEMDQMVSTEWLEKMRSKAHISKVQQLEAV